MWRNFVGGDECALLSDSSLTMKCKMQEELSKPGKVINYARSLGRKHPMGVLDL